MKVISIGKVVIEGDQVSIEGCAFDGPYFEGVGYYESACRAIAERLIELGIKADAKETEKVSRELREKGA